MAATRSALGGWNERPGRVLGPWFALSFGIAVAMLVGVALVAVFSPGDPTPVSIPGARGYGDLRELGWIFANNLVVLALHATACVAGFIAGAGMPAIAEEKEGFSKTLHLNAGRIAIAMVVTITAFSLVTQAYALGLQGASLSDQLDVPVAALVASVAPHALPELTALFLPLAAWTLASRKGEWDQLLAATVVTVAIAIPMLVASTIIEVELWPVLLEQISPLI